jgi:hypothetical protein
VKVGWDAQKKKKGTDGVLADIVCPVVPRAALFSRPCDHPATLCTCFDSLTFTTTDDVRGELFSSMACWIIHRKSISEAVQSNPPVLHLSVDGNLEPNLSWLKAKLDLDDQSICKLVKRLQRALNFRNLEGNLEPKLVDIVVA